MRKRQKFCLVSTKSNGTTKQKLPETSPFVNLLYGMCGRVRLQRRIFGPRLQTLILFRLCDRTLETSPYVNPLILVPNQTSPFSKLLKNVYETLLIWAERNWQMEVDVNESVIKRLQNNWTLIDSECGCENEICFADWSDNLCNTWI